MQPLRGRTAIVTGASHGIGAHVARALVREGVSVALVARSEPELAALARELSVGDVRAVPVPADLATAEGRESLLARAESALGPIDILVNNAGTIHGGALHTRSAVDVAHIAQLNLVAPIELTRVALPGMLARRRGHVVHVASLGGKVPMPYFSLYSATKYGVVGFNNALQFELRDTGVRSSVVCPGFVADEGMWARISNRVHPVLGISQPERVAQAVIDALTTGRVEQIVNPMPVRPAIALWSVAPRLGAAVFRTIGVDRFLGRAAREGSE